MRNRPDTGYCFSEKTKYRKTIWNLLSKNFKNKDNVQILFLPSEEGLEIPLALSLGFKEENLHAVEQNAEFLKNSKWQNYYPLIKIYNMKVSEAIKEINKNHIKLDVLLLDFCNKFSLDLIKEMSYIFKNINSDNFFLSITLLKGRESADMITFLKTFSENVNFSLIAERLNYIMKFIGKHFNFGYKELIRDEYRSTKSNMLYGMYHVISRKNYIEKKISKLEKTRTQIEEIIELDNKITNGIEICGSGVDNYNIAFNKLHNIQKEITYKKNILKTILFDINNTYQEYLFDQGIYSIKEYHAIPILLLIRDFENIPTRRLANYLWRY